LTQSLPLPQLPSPDSPPLSRLTYRPSSSPSLLLPPPSNSSELSSSQLNEASNLVPVPLPLNPDQSQTPSLNPPQEPLLTVVDSPILSVSARRGLFTKRDQEARKLLMTTINPTTPINPSKNSTTPRINPTRPAIKRLKMAPISPISPLEPGGSIDIRGYNAQAAMDIKARLLPTPALKSSIITDSKTDE
jgi:hypothetical protein